MMRKLSVLLAALMLSGFAHSVQLEGANKTITTEDCALLNENVQINLTSGVTGGAACDATRVALAVCHTAGRVVSRTQQAPTPCGCSDAPGEGGAPPANPCTGTGSCTVSGPAMAGASSLLGTVASTYPGGECTAAAAETEAGKR